MLTRPGVGLSWQKSPRAEGLQGQKRLRKGRVSRVASGKLELGSALFSLARRDRDETLGPLSSPGTLTAASILGASVDSHEIIAEVGEGSWGGGVQEGGMQG